MIFPELWPYFASVERKQKMMLEDIIFAISFEPNIGQKTWILLVQILQDNSSTIQKSGRIQRRRKDDGRMLKKY